MVSRAPIGSKFDRKTCRPPTYVTAKSAKASTRWKIGALQRYVKLREELRLAGHGGMLRAWFCRIV